MVNNFVAVRKLKHRIYSMKGKQPLPACNTPVLHYFINLFWPFDDADESCSVLPCPWLQRAILYIENRYMYTTWLKNVFDSGVEQKW